MRKLHFLLRAKALVAFPGGFGTLDECFEVITLLQTKKLQPIPVVLYGTAFWNPFFNLFKTILLDKYNTISAEDLSLFTVTDDDDVVLDIIRNAKPRGDNRQN